MPPSTSTSPAVEFFFDPACPWTWITSRWLVDTAEQVGIDVQWRAMSLGILNFGSLSPTADVSEAFQKRLAVSLQGLRVVEHLGAHNRFADAGRFYTALGTALHVEDADADEATVAGALRTAGVEGVDSAIDDTGLDEAVRASHERSQSLLAGDTGSPILSIDGRAVSGPIVSPAPRGAAALELWQAVQTVVAMPAFFELKRNRDDRPDMS